MLRIFKFLGGVPSGQSSIIQIYGRDIPLRLLAANCERVTNVTSSECDVSFMYFCR